jgi:hypothetical protein
MFDQTIVFFLLIGLINQNHKLSARENSRKQLNDDSNEIRKLFKKVGYKPTIEKSKKSELIFDNEKNFKYNPLYTNKKNNINL